MAARAKYTAKGPFARGPEPAARGLLPRRAKRAALSDRPSRETRPGWAYIFLKITTAFCPPKPGLRRAYIFLKITTAFCPPKPIEFFTAARTRIATPLLGT